MLLPVWHFLVSSLVSSVESSRNLLCRFVGKFDRWVYVGNSCSILKLVYFDSWGWQSFVSTCDVFNCLSTGCTKWNIVAMKSLLFIGLFIGFLVEKCVAFRWHRFRFLPCLMRKRVQKSQAILAYIRFDIGLQNFITCLDIFSHRK